jgi:hypothetical protein
MTAGIIRQKQLLDSGTKIQYAKAHAIALQHVACNSASISEAPEAFFFDLQKSTSLQATLLLL